LKPQIIGRAAIAILLSVPFFSALSASCPDSGRTTVLYLNGVFKSVPEEVDDAARTVKAAIPTVLTWDWTTVDIRSEYNPSDGKVGDLIESADQSASGLDWVQFWEFFLGLKSPSPWFTDASLALIKAYSSLASIDYKPIRDRMTSDVRKEFALGRKVVLLAHSQGNFFANEVVGQLTSAELKSVAIVSVANPDSRIATNVDGHLEVPRVTLLEDLVVAAISAARMASGLDPAMLANSSNLPDLSRDWTGHDFLDTYFQLSYPAWARNRSQSQILANIAKAVRGTESPTGYCGTPTPVPLAIGLTNPQVFKIDGDQLYFSVVDSSTGYNVLYRMPKTSTNLNLPALPASQVLQVGYPGRIKDVVIDASNIYIDNASQFTSYILRVPKDLSSLGTNMATDDVMLGLRNGDLYFNWLTISKISATSNDPSSWVPVATGSYFVRQKVLDANAIYFTNGTTPTQLMRYDFASTAVTPMGSFSSEGDLFQDDQYVYLAPGYVGYGVWQISKQTGAATQIVSGANGAKGVAVGGGYVFYVEGGVLRSKPAAGGVVKDLASPVDVHNAIYDSGTLYWGPVAGDKLYKLTLQ